MAALRSPTSDAVHGDAFTNQDFTNFPLNETDWIVVFNSRAGTLPKPTTKQANEQPKLAEDSKTAALQAWDDIVSRLLAVHLQFRIQDWGNGKLALFVRCPNKVIQREVYRSRVLDWLNDSGISELEPPVTLSGLDLPPLTPAERLRLVHELLTTPTYEGGAGITMDEAVVGVTDAVGGKFIEAIFAPHDKEFANRWIKNWAKKWLLTNQDLDAIRDYAGEKVAYYFAFLRFYLTALTVPALVGAVTWLTQGEFSPVYGVALSLWSIVFIALWNRQASSYATRWGTRNYSKIEKIRPEFRPTKMMVDPVTHERQPFYPYWKRWVFQSAVTLPTTLASIAFLSSVVFVIVTSDVFFHRFYDGPGKSFVGFLPTIGYAAAIPTLQSYYARLATRLSEAENYSTDTQYAASFAQKLFTFNSLVAFFALFAESYLFIPFSTYIGARLKSQGWISSMAFDLGPGSMQARLAYLVITAQVINAFTEVVVPLLTTKYGTVRKGLEKNNQERQKETEEESWVRRARKEFERPAYDVAGDYSEMAIQFGYIMLFSTSYSLTPLFCLLNNFFELRTDAFKICKATRRPTPQRADNIGPWLNNLRLIAYVGSSLTIPSLVTLYRNWNPQQDAGEQAWERLPVCLASILVAEHLYLLLKYIVDEAMKSVPSRGGERRKRAEFELKKTYLLKAGIDILAGGQGGKVRWAEKAGNSEDAVLYGIALKAIHEIVG
ncbi:hypothetical protein PhCBS80983_g00991 [Powellomyces hirtus]|uniref:Anoctamin dimerisation domain-containing protein n=1 Tax=Powellomyces hirtus TaxID=109895 RepID=A0A507EC93_9FUNG|nr:hypothetical protein PhCBS80983_g00991 [Powellomyces hirtus]